MGCSKKLAFNRPLCRSHHLGDLAPQERVFLAFPEIDGSDFFGHAPAADHGTCQSGGLADIVVRAGAHRAEQVLLGRAPAEDHGQAVAFGPTEQVLKERVANHQTIQQHRSMGGVR